MAVKRNIKSSLPKRESQVARVESQELVSDEVILEEKNKTRAPKVEETVVDEKTGTIVARRAAKKVCIFCSNNDNPKYWDANSLRRHTSDRGRINPRVRTGLCAKHQRRLSKHIKYARHLSLMPFKITV